MSFFFFYKYSNSQDKLINTMMYFFFTQYMMVLDLLDCTLVYI